jgi:hypothetical protein
MVDEASARRRGPVTATARQRLQRVANVLEAGPSIAPLAGCRRKGLSARSRGRYAGKSKSPRARPSRNAFHSLGEYIWMVPSGFFESRIAIDSPIRATSMQLLPAQKVEVRQSALPGCDCCVVFLPTNLELRLRVLRLPSGPGRSILLR